VAALLIGMGASANEKDNDGKTPLHCAGNIEVAELLINNGADVMIRDDKYGWTPLHWAERRGHTTVAEVLRTKIAQLRDNLAEEEAILYILKSNNLLANPNDALFWSLKNNKPDIAKWLIIKGGVSVNAKSNYYYGMTPLHAVVLSGYTDVTELLINRGCDVHAKDNYGWTPFHRAAYHGKTDMVELLIRSCANVNEKDNAGNTPLHWAAYSGHTAVAELLIQAGAQVNAKNEFNYTPLHWAAEKGQTAVAELLINNGAQVNEKNKLGWIPLKLAIEQGKNDVAALLRRYGGTE
jgi:ankyrin repeat protein